MNVDTICIKKPKILPISSDIESQKCWHTTDYKLSIVDGSSTTDQESVIFLPGQKVFRNFFTYNAKCASDPKSNQTGKFKSIIDHYYISIVPWVLLINSFVQILVHIYRNESTFKRLVYSPLKRKEILLAVPLEKEQGHLKVAIVYFGGVISGALGATVFQPTLLMVGASAGVYSLLISHIPHIVMNFNEISYRYFRIASVIVLCASDVIFVLNHCLTQGNSEPRISLEAHGCGATAGLLLGFVVYTSYSKPFYKRLRYASAMVYIILVILSIVYVTLH